MEPGRRAARAAGHLPHLLRRSVASAWRHRVLGLSAEAAFWQLLSLPSLFLALVATLGYASRWFGPGTPARTEAQLEDTLSRAFSPQVVDQVIGPMLHEVLYSGRADIISIGFALAIWAGSSATATFVNTITIAYGMRDLRGAVRSRLLALWLFLGSVLVGVVVLPLLVLGPTLLTDSFPERWRPTASTVVRHGYYPTVVALLLVGLTTLYHLAPPRRLPWRRGVPGAVLAILVFLAGSAGLRAYIRFILDHNHAYVTLASPIAALLFFFVLALGVLLGAEFNAAIEQLSPSPVKPPRVLHPRGWQRLDDGEAGEAEEAEDESPEEAPGRVTAGDVAPVEGAGPGDGAAEPRRGEAVEPRRDDADDPPRGPAEVPPRRPRSVRPPWASASRRTAGASSRLAGGVGGVGGGVGGQSDSTLS